MIVVDVESSGTNAAKHSLLSIGAVDFGDPARQFYGECRMWDGAHIMEEALAVNGFSEAEARNPSKQPEGELVKAFFAWLADSAEQTIVGQNPAFDMDFIREAADRADIDNSMAHRSIDIHTACYMHIVKRGGELPVKNRHTAINSDFISTYVGIPPEPRPHIALNGALWEAEQLSRLFYDKNLLEEFKNHPIPWLSRG